MEVNKKERLKYLATTLSNLGVIGLGLTLWQGKSLWTGIGAILFIIYGYILIKRI